MSRIDAEIYGNEAFTEFCRLSSSFYLLKNKEVKHMNLERMQSNNQKPSWNRRTLRRHAPKMDFYSELRAWVQHALLEAERNQDTEKSEMFLSLLKEL
jgi:hypothetical protein